MASDLPCCAAEEASDSSSKSGSSKSQTDKLKTSQQDSLAKQARTIEQETNPVCYSPSNILSMLE